MIRQVILTFQKLFEQMPVQSFTLGRSQKIVIVSLGSIAALGVLARYLRRRRYIPGLKKGPQKTNTKPRFNSNEDGTSQASTRRSGSPSVRSLHRQASLLSGLSDRMSAASGSLPGMAPGDVSLSPQQLGVMESCKNNCRKKKKRPEYYLFDDSGEEFSKTHQPRPPRDCSITKLMCQMCRKLNRIVQHEQMDGHLVVKRIFTIIIRRRRRSRRLARYPEDEEDEKEIYGEHTPSQCDLSKELTKRVEQEQMARHMLVKTIWAIIEERGLYDPDDDDYAICDDDLYNAFGSTHISLAQITWPNYLALNFLH